MPDSFANYMKKEVIKYIKEELDKGVSIKDVKKALLKGGHKIDLIEEAVLDLLRHNFNLKKALQEPVKSPTLGQELYAEVLSSLIEYIEFQKKQGYTTSEIKQILMNYGHSEEILNNAIKSIEKGQHTDSYFKNIRFIASLFVFVVFLLWVSASTGDIISKILVGFFPTIASLIITGAMVNKLQHRQMVFLWFLPFIFSGVFLVLGQSGTYEIFEGMKIVNLTFLNVLLSLVFSIVIISSGKEEEEEPEPMSDLIKKKGSRKKEPRQETEEEEQLPQEQPRQRIREIRPA